MSNSSNSYASSSLPPGDLHIRVERQGLALGAARERTLRADTDSRDREMRLEAAIDDWENEGGTANPVAPASLPGLPDRIGGLRWLADLFRDDTLSRAVIFNGLLLLIAAAGLAVLLND
ncbi:MAG TPA: hypothetical protein DCG90_05160 [Sphingobium sp.]|jgi:hypothetical protein|uniref:hypothetical protein n=1 Tax=unclassified Sphingobium TaxID=2611147 RepID=UPI0007F4AD68|nr:MULTISPECIES: hypothetical protein [unclassified Sphingobium]OAN50960.1 hypothetical protein A7Q26_11030 [Sphingobium sp. TCM1]HAF41143.1 hypothetical protein [Sphingobium sp.]